MVSRSTILEYAQKAALASGANAVYLFGSHARGQAKQHSDVDLLLVFDQPTDLMQAAIDGYMACYGREFALEFIPMHRSHLHAQESLLAEAALKEGVLV
jgi:predicted nucleotidyltransferase